MAAGAAKHVDLVVGPETQFPRLKTRRKASLERSWKQRFPQSLARSLPTSPPAAPVRTRDQKTPGTQRLAQPVGRPTLDLSPDPDLRVGREFRPHVGLHAGQGA